MTRSEDSENFVGRDEAAAIVDSAEFDRLRGLLLGIAYRITGVWSDAEEAVDEGLARLVSRHSDVASQESPLDNIEAWLTTVVTRLCLDRLRRRQRETYVGPWLPEPVDTALLPSEEAELRDSVRLAVLAAYEQLEPLERAAFVLREAYALPYSEIAEILDAKVPTVRQWVSRARRRLDPKSDAAPPGRPGDDVIQKLVDAVFAADLDAVIAVLTEDIRVVGDGGGKVNSARREIIGQRNCAYFLVKAMEGVDAQIEPLDINGETALAITAHGVTRLFQAGEVDGLISRIYLVSNPEKLSHTGMAPSPKTATQ